MKRQESFETYLIQFNNIKQKTVVFSYFKHSGHQLNSKDIIILKKEEKWIGRGVKEAIWVRVEMPSLNKKEGLLFLLSHAWDQILK